MFGALTHARSARLTHVVSSDSVEMPHVLMKDADGSEASWVAQRVVQGLTTSLVEKAQAGENCNHLLQNLGNQLTPGTLGVAVAHGALQAAVVARSSPDAAGRVSAGRTFAARVYLCACSVGDQATASWVSQDRVQRVIFWKGPLLAMELRDGRRALYDDARLEQPAAESSGPNVQWDVRAMVDAYRRTGGRDVLVLGLRSGGILPRTLTEQGVKVACAAESPEAVGAAEAFSGWTGPTWCYGGWPTRGSWDCVFVDVANDASAVEAALRLSRGVCVFGVDAQAAQQVAAHCRGRGACVDVLNADPYAWESNARAVVVARSAPSVPRPRKRAACDEAEEETCPLFMDKMPLGGISQNSGLAGLAALVDEGEPKRRRVGEAQVGMALM